jgi:hypothetical protein
MIRLLDNQSGVIVFLSRFQREDEGPAGLDGLQSFIFPNRSEARRPDRLDRRLFKIAMGTGSDPDSACSTFSGHLEANLHLALYSIASGLTRIFRHNGL